MILRCVFGLVALLMSLVVASANPSGPVVVVPLDTNVSKAQFYFLRRALKEAERDKASAFVIDMSTYGGEVQAAINNMDALMKTSVPTYTYVNPRAISAGALIALATQKIYMSPSAVIGASAPGDGRWRRHPSHDEGQGDLDAFSGRPFRCAEEMAICPSSRRPLSARKRR
jgi:membrane-bound serine protease (ClpP class)